MGVTVDGQEFDRECNSDFTNPEWWGQMREERWWRDVDDEDVENLRFYWDYWHGIRERNCDMVYVNA